MRYNYQLFLDFNLLNGYVYWVNTPRHKDCADDRIVYSSR